MKFSGPLIFFCACVLKLADPERMIGNYIDLLQFEFSSCDLMISWKFLSSISSINILKTKILVENLNSGKRFLPHVNGLFFSL